METALTHYFKYLDRQGNMFNAFLGVVCSILLGVLDLLTTAEYTFSFLYLLPISLTTWFAGKRAGFLVSILCAAFWSQNYFQETLVAATWNILSTLALFLVVTLMLFKIRHRWETESTLSRTDPLTGVMNLRAFTELVEYEILRLQRQCSPFSIAFLDIDNFKTVNDFHGHSKGDELLKAIASSLKNNIRKTDVIARMGGDEFTVFFPETDQNVVKTVVQKVMEGLNELAKTNPWATTTSMGVVTCTNGVCDLEEVIDNADKLMYEVKNTGKNNVTYAVHPIRSNLACT